MAGTVEQSLLVDMLNEARVQGLVTDDELHATLDAHGTRRGARALRRLLASERGPRITRSKAERIALRLLREHGLEPDETDYAIGPYRVDFYYLRERVALEIDGYRYHSTAKRFVTDRRRIAYLAGRGIQVVPFSWDDLHGQVGQAMTNLRRTLEQRRRWTMALTATARPEPGPCRAPRAARPGRRRSST